MSTIGYNNTQLLVSGPEIALEGFRRIPRFFGVSFWLNNLAATFYNNFIVYYGI